MKKRFLSILVIIGLLVGEFCLLKFGVNKYEDNPFTIKQNVTVQHELWQKANNGSSYDDFIAFLNDNKLEYVMKDSKVKVAGLTFEISNNNIVAKGNHLTDNFKYIDARDIENATVKAKYTQDGTLVEKITCKTTTAINGEYYDINLLILLSYLVLVLLVICIWKNTSNKDGKAKRLEKKQAKKQKKEEKKQKKQSKQ